MATVAEETGYYFNRKLLAVALISSGVRLPTGTWLRVATPTATAEQVEQMLAKIFPELKGLSTWRL